MIYQKAMTLLWFAKRPNHWAHAFALAQRKFRADHDSPNLHRKASTWAQENSVSACEALARVGISGKLEDIDPTIFSQARDRESKSRTKMGGAGDLTLLHNAVRLTGASRVVETGVAYGWSSLSILSAFGDNRNAHLVSVDMPYPKLGNDQDVGIVVPDHMRRHWTLIREPDRKGLIKAISLLGGSIDLCHYDSDKSWWGRHYAYPILWGALREGGVFISDDIQDNLYFAEFSQRIAAPFAVTAYEGKFVGIMRKMNSIDRA